MSVSVKGVDVVTDLLNRVPRAINDGTLARAAADELRTLVDEGFQTGTDPSGRKWKPVKDSPGYGTVLDRTGGLRASFKAEARASVASVTSNSFLADIHQPTRQMVPENSLPPDWETRVSSVIEDRIGQLLKSA